MSVDPNGVWLHISQMLALGTPPVAAPILEQPMPNGGTGKPANAVLLDEFKSVLVRQTSKGARKYGQPVRAWNGRDAGTDAIEEWVDLGVYLTQIRLEHADLVAENATLRAEVARLRGEPTPWTWTDLVVALEAAVRSRAELDAIRDSVLADIRANPPAEPLLTELYPEVSPPKTLTCKAGHTRTPGRKCPTCVDAVRDRAWPGFDSGEGY